MLLSAAILLLGCSSALADGHVNNMGCCEQKNVPGSMPKSGMYFLDTQYSETVPDFCKDSCVYIKETMAGEESTGETRFCFKQSSTYTAECQDTGVTGEQGIEITDSHGSEGHESTAGSMEGHGNAKCFTENLAADGSSYTVENIKTDEAGSWTIVFDKAQMLDITVEGVASESWSCDNGAVEGETECKSGATEYPAGTYTVKISSLPDFPWGESVPLIKAFKVGDKDYCEGDDGHGTTSMGGHGDSHGSEGHESTAGSMEGHGNAKCDFTENMAADGSSYTVENIKTDEAGSWTIVFDKAQMLDITVEGVASESWSCDNGAVEGETECKSGATEYPAGTYTVKISSLPDFPWGESVPLIKAFKVGDKDYCEDSHGSENHESTAGSMEGHANAKCENMAFTENMAADGSAYTSGQIKTDEAGSWTFVFDKASDADISIIKSNSIFEGIRCNANSECSSGEREIPAGTYTVKVSSNPSVPWDNTDVPLVIAFKVGDKFYCKDSHDSENHETTAASMEGHGGDDSHNDMANHNSMGDHNNMENHNSMEDQNSMDNHDGKK